jgi:hypothetical protein
MVELFSSRIFSPKTAPLKVELAVMATQPLLSIKKNTLEFEAMVMAGVAQKPGSVGALLDYWWK